MGPFFKRMRVELRETGVTCARVNFNTGDDLFDSQPDVIRYRGRLEEWPDFLSNLISRDGFDAIFLFGDGRPYHRAAVSVARTLDIPVYVFEEGYLRPHFVTLEQGGVNGYSTLPRDPATYLHSKEKALQRRSTRQLPTPGSSFRNAGWYSTLYSLAITYFNWGYPHYRHHRPMHAAFEAFAWLRAALRKYGYAVMERHAMADLTTRASGRFFVVPLQVYCDYQLKHSRFTSVEVFIDFLVEHFAAHAPGDAELVLKHHPLDRGYKSYTRQIERLRNQLSLHARLHYVHDLHLPTLLDHARGCVTINSTVGLQAIHHGVAVKVLGEAVYDIKGLTSPRTLEDFWSDPGEVDKELYAGFRRWLLHHNQGRGSFYRKLPGIDTPTGVLWPPALTERADDSTASTSRPGSAT